MRNIVVPVVLLACTISLSHAQTPSNADAAATATVKQTPLLDRSTFFGNPTRAGGSLSPDGKWLSFIAPRDGVLNVWIAPVGKLAAARPLTNERSRPIRSAFWSPDSTMVMYVNDKGGDENYLLYAVATKGGKPRLLTPFQNTRVEIFGTSNKVRERILVGINNRDASWHDVYSLDLASGKLTLVLANTDEYAGFTADEQLQLRIVQKSGKDGGTDYFRVIDGKPEKTPFVQVPMADNNTTSPLGLTGDGKTLYWMDARGRDTAALVAQDLDTLHTTVLAQDPRADIDSSLTDPKTGIVQAYLVNYLKQEYRPIGTALADDLAYLREHLKGPFKVTSRSDADDTWLLDEDDAAAPAATWVYQRAPRKLTRLYVRRAALEKVRMAPMTPHEIRSRDGLTLVSYLTLPVGAVKPVPMVLLVHGGPWERDNYGYHPHHQWLANRGYAVLSVNYRGSTGFGKKFIGAGDMQWGRKMHDDLVDAVDWAIAQGITTEDKVAIMGGSYGGYATLAGLTFTPTKFACGVDIVGPSNLTTFLASLPAYWEFGRQQLYQRLGDPNTDAGRVVLHERSPVNFADRIVRPLLIAQGANDPRVKLAESDQIVEAMKVKNIPVTYVVFPDEGHGFVRPGNSIAFHAVAENFLARCLGGRAEPIGTALKNSTAQIRHGAQYAPGLEAASK